WICLRSSSRSFMTSEPRISAGPGPSRVVQVVKGDHVAAERDRAGGDHRRQQGGRGAPGHLGRRWSAGCLRTSQRPHLQLLPLGGQGAERRRMDRRDQDGRGPTPDPDRTHRRGTPLRRPGARRRPGDRRQPGLPGVGARGEPGGHRPASAVTLRPPLRGTAYLPDLARVLPDHGYSTVLPQVPDEDRLPFAARYVARASLETHRLVGEQEARDGGSRTPVALVAEGDAGPLLSAVGAAQRAAHRPVLAYVFVNAWLPQPGSPTRAEIVHRQSPERGNDPGEEADVPSEYWTERLQTVPDWPDAP